MISAAGWCTCERAPPPVRRRGQIHARSELGDGKIRVAIIGVGNCASSFVQGVEFYRNASPTDLVPGLMHVDLGGYHVGDIEFSAAFDINITKAGKDLAEDIQAAPNNTQRFAEVPPLSVKVHRGMTHDGLGKYLSQIGRAHV